MSPSTGSPTEAHVLEALKSVQDPDMGRNLVDLKAVQDIQIVGGNVTFNLVLPTPAAPAKKQLQQAAEAAVGALPGVERVIANLTSRIQGAKPLLGGKGMIPGVANIVAVSSGKGGVGKSTVSVNLACALQRDGARVGLLDADVYGPNVPIMLGLEGKPQAQEKKLEPLDFHGMKVMSIGFMIDPDKPVIWRGPMMNSAIKEFLHTTNWGQLDYLIVDLPPGTGDAQLSLAQQCHLMGAVVVTTPQDVSVADVRRAIRMFETVEVPVLGVVENMAWFTPPGQSERYEIFGKGGGEQITREFNIPMLGQLPIDLAVREGGDAGKPVALSHPDSAVGQAFGELSRHVAARIAETNQV